LKLDNFIEELNSWKNQPWLLEANVIYSDFVQTLTANEIRELYRQHQKEVDNKILTMIKLGKSKAGIIFSNTNDLIQCLIYYRFSLISSFCNQKTKYIHDLINDELTSSLLSLMLLANFADSVQLDGD
jgi:hypothetical protein